MLQMSFGPLLGVGLGALHRLFLLTTCPGKLYSKFNQGTAVGNPVLDRILREIANSMRNAYLAGVPTRIATFYIVCLGVAGDHVFQAKAFRCDRHHVRTSICPLCLANTGNMPFEDCNVDRALWAATVCKSNPWRSAHPLAMIPGAMEPSFIKFDLMHVLPHGCGRTYMASVLAMLAGPLKVFQGNSKQARLMEAYSHFAAYCEAVHVYPRDMQEFTPDNLGWKFNRDFPEMTCKASDTTILFGFMLDYLSSTPLLRSDPLEWAYKGCAGFDSFNRLCYMSQNRLFWTRAEAQEGYDHLNMFLRAYKALAGTPGLMINILVLSCSYEIVFLRGTLVWLTT